jgi:hypothetical protein
MNPIINSKPFAPGYDDRRNMNGRPKALKTILTGYGLTPSQTTELINELMMCNEIELKTLAEDETATIFETTIATALLKAKGKGSLFAIETILNRSQGLPKAAQDITIQDKTYDITLSL